MKDLVIIQYWKSISLVIIPLMLLPLPFVSGTETARCAYVLLIMAFYWMMELVPLAVTSLIPVALFPLFGIMSTSDVCMQYMKNTNMLFLGGLIVAIAVEHCNLHRRIAITAMYSFGTTPEFLMAGFMLPTAFLSMWISNTATTAMMIPIVEAVLTELSNENEEASNTGISQNGNVIQTPVKLEKNSEDIFCEGGENNGMPSNIPFNQSKEDEEEKLYHSRQRKMMMMAVCFSANVGGTGTIIGTAPNLILMENMHRLKDQPLTFGSWMLFAVPPMLVCLVLIWTWLKFYYIGFDFCKSKKDKSRTKTKERAMAAKRVIKEKYKQLGPFKFNEFVVLICFISLVILWFFREPGFITGWGDKLITENKHGDEVTIDDATPAIIIAFLLFVLPAKPNFTTLFKKKSQSLEPSEPIIDWKTVERKMPWAVVFLIGGGFALATGSEKSCLSAWIGQQLSLLDSIPHWILGIILSIITCALTQIASNAATSSIMMPVLLELSVQLEVNPLYFMLPTCLVCSYAFMLPVSTGPNAIAFGPSRMSTLEMMRLGFVANILCIIVIIVFINTLGIPLFKVDEFPDWAFGSINSTNVCYPDL